MRSWGDEEEENGQRNEREAEGQGTWASDAVEGWRKKKKDGSQRDMVERHGRETHCLSPQGADSQLDRLRRLFQVSA